MPTLIRFCLLLALGAGSALAQDPTATPEPDPCEAFSIDGTDLAYYVGQGDVTFTLGDNTTAIVLYTCALAQDASYTPALINRGYAYYAQGRFDLALADFDAALALDEARVDAYINRGIVYTAEGRFALALADFDLVIALNPTSAPAYNNRAIVHAIEQNYDLALADVETAIALEPDTPGPYAVRAMVYSALAAASYDQFRERVPRRVAPPAGAPDIVLNAISAGRASGAYSIWLAALVRGE